MERIVEKSLRITETPLTLTRLELAASPTVNNGVQLKLSESAEWTVTGECWLNVLECGADCRVIAPEGRRLRITADGLPAAPGGRLEGLIHITVE